MSELQDKFDNVLRLHEAEVELHERHIAHLERIIAALREQLAEAQTRIDALESSMNPQDVCDIDAALRAKTEVVRPHSDELRSQNVALRERNAELEALTRKREEQEAAMCPEDMGFAEWCLTLEKQRDRALSELAEARKDTERLDWLSRTRGVTLSTFLDLRVDKSNRVTSWTIEEHNPQYGKVITGQEPLREAIDAARAAIPETAPNRLASSEYTVELCRTCGKALPSTYVVHSVGFACECLDKSDQVTNNSGAVLASSEVERGVKSPVSGADQ